MNYSEMTDFEINKAVAAALCVNYVISAGEVCYMKFDDQFGDSYPESLDYCNDPEFSWPIIVQNRISITPCLVEGKLDEWDAESYVKPFFYCENKNPLRAAMTVFLNMKNNNHG